MLVFKHCNPCVIRCMYDLWYQVSASNVVLDT